MRKFKYIIQKYYPFILIFLLSLLYIMPQMMQKNIIFGADSHFHFNRLYDNYMQLKTHHFSIFQSNFGFDQSGRIVNALYGPGFAWLLSIILYVVHSWSKFQIVTCFIIFFFAGVFMYLLSRRIRVNKKYATIAALIFMASYWITCWNYAESYMAWGTMWMPLIAMMGIDMMEFDDHGISIIHLALIVSTLVQIHVLSTLLSVITLVPCFIIGLIKNKDKVGLLKKVVLAALISIVLTINVWLPMMEVYSTNKIIPPFPVPDMSGLTETLSLNAMNINEVGFAISLLSILAFGYLILNRKNIEITDKTLIIIGLLFLIVSSKLLPWKLIGQSIPSLQSSIQFPYRFLTMATVLLIPEGCKVLSKISFKNSKINYSFSGLIILATALSCVQSWQTLSQQARDNFKNISYTSQVVREVESSDLGKGLHDISPVVKDYLPNNTGKDIYALNNADQIYLQETLNNQKGFKKRTVKDKLIVSWYSKNNKPKRVPVFVYHNSRVVVNGKLYAHNKLHLSAYSVPKVKSKVGYNELAISYHSKFVTANLLRLVLFIWICMIALLFVGYFKKLRWKHN